MSRKLSVLVVALTIYAQFGWADSRLNDPAHFDPADIMVIGHRGAAGQTPENTLVSIRAALRQNADAIEVDLHQSSDGIVVAIHDKTVDRTTNGNGKVADLTAAELKQLDAGRWYDSRFAGERIPTLDEVLAAVPPETTLILEVKQGSDIYPGIETHVVNSLRNAGRTNVILKSFSIEVLAAFKRIAPKFTRLYVFVAQIPVLNLVVDDGLRVGDAYDQEVSWLQIHSSFITECFVRRAQGRGFRVVAWNVHDLTTMREMVALRVDAIETDYPDVLNDLLTDANETTGEAAPNRHR